MTTPEAVKAILECTGGRIVGKTRLQKSAYFLEAAGVGDGFDFSYHYYGPYSEDLAVAAGDAEALGLIQTNWESSQAGLSYAVYAAVQPKKPEKTKRTERRGEILQILDGYDALSLELAATAHYLAKTGYEADPWEETRKRKSIKATPDRVAKAKRLLAELGI
jgi:uncharacterized protein